MADYIDIMKVQPLSNAEERLAFVELSDGQIVVTAPDREYWKVLLREIVQVDPDEFFAALPEKVRGTYIYASKPRSGDPCAAGAGFSQDLRSHAAV